jgi:hypothetical protein
MRVFFCFRCLLLIIVLVVPLIAQEQKPDGAEPVTKDEIRSLLEASQDSPEAIEQSNRELLAAVRARGVDFALSKEEEWSLDLLEASDELLEAIRAALSQEERELRLKIAELKRLYYQFANNYRKLDIASQTAALEAGKEFVRRFGEDKRLKDIVAYMTRTIPQLESMVRNLTRRTLPTVVRRNN